MSAERLIASLVEHLPEPTLLVSADGVIHAASAEFTHRFVNGGPRPDGTSILEYVVDPPLQVSEYLRRCTATRQPVPGALTVAARGGDHVRVQCEGWVIFPRAGESAGVVALRFLKKNRTSSTFAELTRRVGELTSEIGRRRRAEAQLASALEARTELQRRFEMLADAPAMLLSSLALEDVQRQLGALTRRLIPADACAIWRFDDAAAVWRIVWGEELSDAFIAEVSRWQGSATRAVPFDRPLAVPDVTKMPMLAERLPAYEAERIRSMLVVPLRIRGDNHGTIVAYFRTPTDFPSETLRIASALGNLGSSSLTTATLYEFELRARQKEELSGRRARFLARATAALTESLDYENTLRTVARLAVPEVADWCTVDILDRDGNVRRLEVAHVDEEKVQLARALSERYPEDPAAPYSAHEIMRTKTPLVMSDIPDTLLESAARDAAHLAILRQIGLRSFMRVPLVAHGHAIGVITFVAEESGRHYTADDLRFAEEVAARAALAVENARAYEEARRANRLKDDFLATLSHELRTPLNAILGYVRMLREGVVTPEREPHALEVMERNAGALNRMVEDILDVSRVVSGNIRLNVHAVKLPAVVQDAIGAVLPAADAKGVHIGTDLDLGTPAVNGDAARLQQVVWNLLSNAVKFTPSGGRVQVRVVQSNGFAEVVVSDTGVGVEPDFLPYVFDRFRQGDASFSRKHGGLGLGLAIARHFVELHGGTITAESGGLNQGATFRVRLPLRSDA